MGDVTPALWGRLAGIHLGQEGDFTYTSPLMKRRGIPASAVPCACTLFAKAGTHTRARWRPHTRGGRLTQFVNSAAQHGGRAKWEVNVEWEVDTDSADGGDRALSVSLPPVVVGGIAMPKGTDADAERTAPNPRSNERPVRKGMRGIPEPPKHTLCPVQLLDQTVIPPGDPGGITSLRRLGVADPPAAALGRRDGTQAGVLGQHHRDRLGPPQTVGVPPR